MEKYNSHTEKCKEFFRILGIKNTYIEEVRKAFWFDYYGLTNENHIIAEYKSKVKDISGGIIQLLRYYNLFKREIQYPSIKKLPFYSDKKIPKIPIELYLFYDGVDYIDFEKYHSLYRDYLANPNCPKIKFCYFNQHNILATLE